MRYRNSYEKSIFYGGFSKQIYQKFKESIDNRKYKALFNVCLVYIAMFLALFIIYAVTSKTNNVTLFVYLIGVIVFLILSIILNNGSQRGVYDDRCVWTTISAACIFSTYCTLHTNCGPAAIALFFTIVPIILPVPIHQIGIFNTITCILITLSDLKIHGLSTMIDDVPIFLIGLGIGVFIGAKNGGLRVHLDAIIHGSLDALTQIYNRRAFDAVYMKRLRRGKSFGFIMFDVDKFKDFNDKWGHTVGDKVLRSFAQTLDVVIEENDGQFFRYGGEEFCAIFSNCANEADLGEIVEECLEAVRDMKVEHRQNVLAIRTSAGYAVGRSADLKDRADKASQMAKRKGRDQAVAASSLEDLK